MIYGGATGGVFSILRSLVAMKVVSPLKIILSCALGLVEYGSARVRR